MLLLILMILRPLSDARAAITFDHPLYIRDDATGGDCSLIGNWDAASKTCTLTTDVTFYRSHGIVITDTADGSQGSGVTL
ncbi:MAG: hypothetical protein AB1760_13935, partial [Pseudomonadota bacterium]